MLGPDYIPHEIKDTPKNRKRHGETRKNDILRSQAEALQSLAEQNAREKNEEEEPIKPYRPTALDENEEYPVHQSQPEGGIIPTTSMPTATRETTRDRTDRKNRMDGDADMIISDNNGELVSTIISSDLEDEQAQDIDHASGHIDVDQKEDEIMEDVTPLSEPRNYKPFEPDPIMPLADAPIRQDSQSHSEPLSESERPAPFEDDPDIELSRIAAALKDRFSAMAAHRREEEDEDEDTEYYLKGYMDAFCELNIVSIVNLTFSDIISRNRISDAAVKELRRLITLLIRLTTHLIDQPQIRDPSQDDFSFSSAAPPFKIADLRTTRNLLEGLSNYNPVWYDCCAKNCVSFAFYENVSSQPEKDTTTSKTGRANIDK